jgi:hypothetical protein
MNLKSFVAAAVLGTAALSSFAASETLQFTYSGPGTVTGFGGTLASDTIVFSGVKLDGVTVGLGNDVLGDGTMWQIDAYGSATSHLLSYSYAGTGTIDTSSLGFTVSGSNNPVVPSSVAAVPEPETYAMMLAGLGALGFLGRRRKTA